MTNVFSPNGFQFSRRVDGAALSDAPKAFKIAAANTHSFFKGDPVIALASGYIDRVAIGSIPAQGTLGIFQGCEYYSTAQQRKVWSPQFPGGDTTQDITAYLLIDPNLIFTAWVGTGASSAAGGPATQADLFGNYNWQIGTGNTANGFSGAYLDYASFATTSTLPLTIIGLVTNPPGVNGTDITSVGNQVEVILNQAFLKTGTQGL